MSDAFEPVEYVFSSNTTQTGLVCTGKTFADRELPHRVLCIGQTDKTTNGIWNVSRVGWVRAPDANRSEDFVSGKEVSFEYLGTVGTYTYIGAPRPGLGYSDLSFSGGIVEGSDQLDLSSGVGRFDTVHEHTAGAGVTLDGVKLKDSEVYTDVIKEKTSAAGVTLDGVLLKDSEVTTDVIKEKTGAAGVTIDGCLIKDGRAALLATAAIFKTAVEVTGDGNPQNTAHGLGAVPTLVFAIPSNLSGGAYAVTAGVHDATNAIFTVTNGEKYHVVAIK